MGDPHVVSLRYRLLTGDGVSYDDPPGLTRRFDGFSISLEDAVLTCEMEDHFPIVAEARKAVELVLRAWEIDAALNGRRGEISFSYESSEVIDRDRPPGQLPPIRAEGRGVVTFGASVSVHVTRKRYPDPPEGFAASPDVETLWSRYEAFMDGREPLLAMSYFCLTVLQAREGSRAQAATVLNIEPDVLDKIGELTSTRGDPSTARKVSSGATLQALTSSEERWLKAVVPAIVRQVGQHDAGVSPEALVMRSLPPLAPE